MTNSNLLGPSPELSSDLEWMLQSGQASSAMLAEALVFEFYGQLFPLAHVMLGDRRLASMAVRDAFSAALMNVYGYRSNMSVKNWFYSLALPFLQNGQRSLRSAAAGVSGQLAALPDSKEQAALCQATLELEESARLLVLLRFLLGWPIPEIAVALRFGEENVAWKLSSARTKLGAALVRAGLTAQEIPQGRLEAALSVALQANFPAPDLSERDLKQFSLEVAKQAQRGGRLRRHFTSAKEALWIGIAVLLVLGLVWGANALIPDPGPASEPLPTPAPTQPSRPRRPRPTISAAQAMKPVPTLDSFYYDVQPGDTFQSIASQFKGISAQDLEQLNRWPPGEALKPGQRLFVLLPSPEKDVSLPTPVSPAPPAQPLLTSSSLPSVLQRLQHTWEYWHTLWVDALIGSFGPPGYIGPPQVYHTQIWLSQNQVLVLGGSQGGEPEEIFMGKGSQHYLARPGSNLSWFFQVDQGSAASSQVMNYALEVFGALIQSTSHQSWQVTGNEMVAGRRTLILDQLDDPDQGSSKLWMDAQTGLVLRKQEFAPGLSRILLREVKVTAVDYDVNFPQPGLFDPQIPWRGGFARDYTGQPLPTTATSLTWSPAPGHEPLTYRPLPDGFDPSHSQLAFQYPANYQSRDAQSLVSIFADGFFLGGVEFGDPWTMVCDRSPDGSKIAYVSQPFVSPPEDASLHWFNLSNPLGVGYRPMRNISVTQLVFAPDSRRLAVFGYDGVFTTGSIFILDTDTNRYFRLLDEPGVVSLVWSPDGEYLAFIRKGTVLQFEDEVIVVRSDTGEIVFHTPMGSETKSKDWPTAQWGVEFPAQLGGFEACVSPPQ